MLRAASTLLLLVFPIYADEPPAPANPPASAPAVENASLVGTWHLDMAMGEARVKGVTEYKEWKLLDGAGFRDNPEMLWTLLPALPRGVEIPAVKRELLPEER